MSLELAYEISKLETTREQLVADWKFCVYKAYFLNFKDVEYKNLTANLIGGVIRLRIEFADSIIYLYSCRVQPVSTNTLEAYRNDYVYTFVPSGESQLVCRDDCGVSIPYLLYNDSWSVHLFLYDCNRKQITDIPLHFLEHLDQTEHQRWQRQNLSE